MQNEHISLPKMNEYAISARMQRLLARLEELWQYPNELTLTFEALKRIIVGLPEEDQPLGIETIAEYLVQIVKLHFLDIVATFRQKAEDEEISAEDQEEILHDARQESFRMMQRISRQLSVKSIDDLVILSNITFGLYGLSQVTSAEQAESWIYNLPRMYLDRLKHEGLLKVA